MSQIPTPPASRPGSEAPEAGVKPADAADTSSELRQSLDSLLEQYLHLLDRQQQLQSGLSEELSSGFLALAHANYTCPPGRRYGSDYYDERMKATGKISINPTQEVIETESAQGSQDEPDSSHAGDFEYNFSLQRVSNREPDEETDVKEGAKDDTKDNAKGDLKDNVEDKVKQTPSTESTGNTSPQDTATPATPEEIDPPKPDESTTEAPPKESKVVRKKFRSENPIHWYGILVPPSLRTAQSSFTTATQSHIPELAGTVVEMRALEDRITRLRTQIEGQNTSTAGRGTTRAWIAAAGPHIDHDSHRIAP